MTTALTTPVTRQAIVTLGGAFMTSPQLRAEEARLGLPDRSLYFRGRSAVLGDPPAAVVTALFGIFPDWLIELVLDAVTPLVPAPAAIDAYTRACAAWGAEALGSADNADEAADLLYRIVDSADLSGLPLAAGWRVQQRPAGPSQRLAHALMLARELRGGLHFAALRACGLSVPEATLADPHGGRPKLLRTGWRPEDVDALIERAAQRPDLQARWQRAERLTDEAFATDGSALGTRAAARLTDLLTECAAARLHRAG